MLRFFVAALFVFFCLGSSSCMNGRKAAVWGAPVDLEVSKLGRQSWIVISEASFPAYNQERTEQMSVNAEVPEVLDHIISSLEQTENLRPSIYRTREFRALENRFAPGVDSMRKEIDKALHGHETIELEQSSLMTLLSSASKNYRVLVIRTQTSVPYSSIFIELRPGYWDAESEGHLRKKIERDQREKLAQPES